MMAQGKGKGTHTDKGKGWGVPPGSGTSHKGCDKGHQGKHADKGKLVEGKGWGVLIGHADKGKPVESKGLGVHIGRWPSDTGRQGNHSDQGKLVKGEGKGRRARTEAQSQGVGTVEAQIRPKYLG